MQEPGLDGRHRDQSGQIRRKNPTTLIRNMVPDYPELSVLTPDATLSGVMQRHQLAGLEEVRQFARDKAAQQRRTSRQ